MPLSAISSSGFTVPTRAGSQTPPSRQELQRLEELKRTDRQVRQHEQMHVSVGRELVTSGPTFTYEQGVDGRRYAVSGEVGIDTTKAPTPEATIPKAEHIQATALAPPDPSAQDRQVAAKAMRMEMEARLELAQLERQARQETQGGAGKEKIPPGLQSYRMVGELAGPEGGPTLSAYA